MKRWKKWSTLVMSMMMTIGLVSCNQDERIQIGILQYDTHGALDAAKDGVIAAFEEAGYDESKIKFNILNPFADPTTLSSMAKTILRDNEMVVAIATPAAIAVANEAKNNKIDKPILFTAVTDAVDAKLVSSNEAPGSNVTGTSDMNPVADQIALAKQLLPTVETIGILYTSSEVNSQVQVDLAIAEATKLGIEVKTATITSTNELQQVARTLVTNNKIDLLYLPTDNLIASSMDIISSISTEFLIPTICGEASLLEHGGLITLGIDYFKLGKLTGQMAIEILEGRKEPATFPVGFLQQFDMTINKKIADEMGFTIPQALLDQATTIITE